jgi:hypothetical protein
LTGGGPHGIVDDRRRENGCILRRPEEALGGARRRDGKIAPARVSSPRWHFAVHQSTRG